MRQAVSQNAQTSEPAEASTTQAAQPAPGALSSAGAAAVDRMLAEEGAADGGGDPSGPGDPDLERYRRALGRLLGPALYNLVVDAVNPKEIAKYAKQGLDAARGQVISMFRAAARDGGAEDKQAAAFAGVLNEKLEGLAKELLKTPAFEAIASELSSLVAEHPWMVVASMLLASAAAYMTDIPIEGEVPVTLGKTGLKVKAKADMGSIQHIQYEGVSLALSYARKIDAHEKGKPDKEISAEANVSHTPQVADASAPSEGILRYGGKIEFKNFGAMQSFVAEYNHDFAGGVPVDIFRTRMNVELKQIRTKFGANFEMRDGEVVKLGASSTVVIDRNFSLMAGTDYNPSVGHLTQTAGLKAPKLEVSMSYTSQTNTWMLHVKIPLNK